MAKTVLIVEDNELNQKLMRDLLEARGLTTLCADEGEQGLSLARERRPDLILMDIQLPGISGYEVTRHIKADEDLRHIPVVAVTALARDNDRDAALEAGCDAYISKPISPMGFLMAVKDFLDR